MSSNSPSCDLARPALHEGPASQFLLKYDRYAHEAMKKPPSSRGDFHSTLLELIADPRNLKAAWAHLKRKNSQGAGPDGLTFADFTRQSTWQRISQLSKHLLKGKYRHGGFRPSQIQKHPGSAEKRLIWIANVADRVVARAVAQILAPIYETSIPETTFCRRRRGRLRAITLAKILTEELDVKLWITQDLQNAFPSVPKPRLLDIVRKFTLNTKVVDLVEHLIDNDGQNGLPPGSPIASILLTLYVHQTIVHPWQKLHPGVPLLAYLDDFLLLPAQGEECDMLCHDLERLTNSAGFTLKYDWPSAVTNVADARTPWLGYEVHRPGKELQIRVPWANSLTECNNRFLPQFLNLHNHPDAVLLAPKALRQIVSQVAVAYPQVESGQAISWLKHVAKDAGFDDLPADKTIKQFWCEHYDRWRLLYETMSTKPLEPRQFVESQVQRVVIHTDGCCLGRSGVGGWAFIIQQVGQKPIRRRRGLETTTNNRAELIAVIRSLESLSKPCRVVVKTDSQYVANGFRSLSDWREQAWRCGAGSQKRTLRNLDLWRELYRLRAKHEITVKWIRGHNGLPENEWCDRQARIAAQLLAECLT